MTTYITYMAKTWVSGSAQKPTHFAKTSEDIINLTGLVLKLVMPQNLCFQMMSSHYWKCAKMLFISVQKTVSF